MALIGYVTLDEANTYISEHYLSKDSARQQWEALDDSDKSVLLRQSFQAIELLPFSGRKTCPDQENAFPRWPSDTVPNAIKFAQIENALSKSDPANDEDAKYYERLWTFGVESYSIGNLSETVGTGSYGAGAQSTGIVSAAAQRLLKAFVSGGYRI